MTGSMSKDHARALELIVRKGEPGQVYNIGADAEATNIDMVRAICGWMDQLVPDSPYRPHADLIAFVADRPGHDRRYAIDSSRIREELGWRPAFDLHEGLGRTVRWYLEKPLVVASNPRRRIRGSPASGSTGRVNRADASKSAATRSERPARTRHSACTREIRGALRSAAARARQAGCGGTRGDRAGPRWPGLRRRGQLRRLHEGGRG